VESETPSRVRSKPGPCSSAAVDGATDTMDGRPLVDFIVDCSRVKHPIRNGISSSIF
jgi:hypothetical protein